MKKTKIIAAILALAISGTMSMTVFGADTTDGTQSANESNTIISEYLPNVSEEHILTRADLVMILHAKEGKPVVNYAMNYSDVKGNEEYAEAIRWATSEKIASDYKNGKFCPNEPVTREQLAVILYHYVQNKQQGFTGSWAFLLDYSDTEQISESAYEAVCWMTMYQIMGDTGNRTFAPKQKVTAKEANDILKLFFETLDTFEGTETANSFVECETIEEAGQIAGFSAEVPTRVPDWVNDTIIHAVQSSLIEVIYQGDQDNIVIRKEIGDTNISENYPTYAEGYLVKMKGRSVNTRGEDGKIMVATWQDNGYTYSVQAENGLERTEMLRMISYIK